MAGYAEAASLIDKKKTQFIDRLRQAVEIPSVSADAAFRNDIFRMIDWTQKELEKLGTKCEQIKNGKQKLPSGEEIDLPPVLFGTLGNDKAKKTLLELEKLGTKCEQIKNGKQKLPSGEEID
uniref:Uncharacterized protein n=1 Tax=Panagrolaimus sp. ES5 TaxID=591445 RepID=A0AC34FHQ2_9BILA